MLHDILPSVYDNSFCPRAPKEGDFVLCFSGFKVLCSVKDGVASLPKYPSLDATYDDYLFQIDGIAYYGYEKEVTLQGFEYTPVRTLFRTDPKRIPFASSTACHIVSWKNINRFCGRCGTKMENSKIERALVCPCCNNTVYPNIHPAVNIAIRNGDKLLLAKHIRRTSTPYVLIAGFMEIGESAEATVKREVMEEVGLKVKNIRYYGSQPWGIVGNLQLGFVCDVDGSDEIHIDGTEIEDARWFERSEIEADDSNPSITGAMIQAFRRSEI